VLQGQQDFQVLRKRFVPELLMALHDSPLADGAARTLALSALCRATRIPAAARDLALHAGAGVSPQVALAWLLPQRFEVSACSGRSGALR
jgi:Nucleolar pre-ribosomal-associated protein 1